MRKRMHTKSTRARLLALVKERALILGPIILSSGKSSNHYFDCRRVTLHSEGADLVGEAICDVIDELPVKPESVGGLTVGADPIVGAVMMKARQRGNPVHGFYVRKQPKGHGTKNRVENSPSAGAKVLVVDDVVTAGGSVLDAIDAIEEQGCQVVGVAVIIDRLEGGGDKIRARVKNYIPIFTRDDFRSEIDATAEPLPTRLSGS